MPELYTIRLYYNTGFNRINRPSGPSTLMSADYVDYPSNYLWQDQILAKTRIKATWPQVRDADYCKIGPCYYIITGRSMLSGQTAELSLEIDPIITIGGVGTFSFISGWTERAHVAAVNDLLFSNTLNEPFVPTRPLELDALERIGPSHTTDKYIIESTVKLTELEYIARVYQTEAEALLSGEITIPEIPVAPARCVFRMGFPDNTQRIMILPAASVYDYEAAGIPDGVNSVRSLGIDGAIVDAYQLPAEYVTVFEKQSDGATYLLLANSSGNSTPSTNLAFRYGNYVPRNNKVYDLFNNYYLLSSCSGNRGEYSAHDIFNNSDVPSFSVYADLAPTGRPYIQPLIFHGSQTGPFQEAIAGEEWYRLPLSFTGRRGSAINEAMYQRSERIRQVDNAFYLGETIGGVLGSALTGDIGGAITETIGGVKGTVMRGFEETGAAIEHQTKQNIVEPEIRFPQNYGAQAYLGNTFYIYRTRLSDSDMEKADDFFTQFGYAQDKKAEASDLTNRSRFNYIKTRDAAIYSDESLTMRQLAADTLNSGVRLWHVMPSPQYMTDNP